MKVYKDQDKINYLIQKYKINEMFDKPRDDLVLCAYSKGEIINRDRPYGKYIRFLIRGSIRIYSKDENGNEETVCRVAAPVILGETEFIGAPVLPLFTECTTACVCFELNAANCREELMRDNAFLRTLLTSLAHKTTMMTQIDGHSGSLRTKLLRYMQINTANGVLCGIEAAAETLHCSRRQLLRVLKTLTDEGIINKLGKGCYSLVTTDGE